MALVDNFQDFIKYHAEAAGMTREEYMAVLMSEANKKPGPDPYHRGLEDDEVEDKEDQIKKQADMDDDDPDAYKEMPGDKEAREKGEVKTSKATKAYNKLYKENKHVKSMNEMAMGYDAHTGLFYIKGVPFTEERLEQVLKHLKTKIKLGDLPKQFSYFPAIQVADDAGGETVTLTLDKVKDIEAALKRFKGKLAHDGDFNEAVNPVETVNESFKFGQKKQYSMDDINSEYGFWGTLEIHMDPESIEEIWHDVWGILTKSWKFSDAGALYFLNAKAGRHLADKVYNDINSQISQPDAIDMILSDYARPSRWKAWSKEYNEFAQEEMMSEAENPIKEADDTEQKSTDRGPLDDDKIETALKKKAEDTGVPIGIIRAVMRRGLAAWKSGHRPGANQQQWGYARVNAFLTKGEGTWGKADKDLAKEVRDGGHDKKLKKA